LRARSILTPSKRNPSGASAPFFFSCILDTVSNAPAQIFFTNPLTFNAESDILIMLKGANDDEELVHGV